MDFLTLVDEGQCNVSVPKQKEKREFKNLKCSINFDARSVSSSRVRGKRLGVFFCLLGFFRVFFLCFLFFFCSGVLIIYSMYT